jgi:UV DNA damage endonuclease
LNYSLPCRPNRTFRLVSYSAARVSEALIHNLRCLDAMVDYNRKHGLLFLRLSSDLIPFASHPRFKFPWRTRFRQRFAELGAKVRAAGLRLSMHPDQFTLINSPDHEVFRRSARELAYHAEVFDALGLDATAKVQIHVGGVYGDKVGALRRFRERYRRLSAAVRRRLVIENDDVSYTVRDCLRLSRAVGVPVLFDSFHHEVNGNGEGMLQALTACSATWRRADGLPMVDYSSQAPGGRRGKHTDSVDLRHFRLFALATRTRDFDLMLEIKDKEKSALRVLAEFHRDPRLVTEAGHERRG